MKRILSALLAATMAAGVLSGCGGSGDAPSAPAESAAASGGSQALDAAPSKAAKAGDGETVKLRYTGWGAPNEKKTTQNAIDGYMQAHPGVEVEYIHIPTDYNTKLTTMIAANQGPDVAMLNGDTSLLWASQGKLKNILDNMENDPDVKLDDFLPQVVYWWEEDKACGVNAALEVFGIYYNRDILAGAGIEVPTTQDAAWSWEEFLGVCQKLTVDNNGKTAADEGFDPGNVRQFGVMSPSGMNAVSYGMAYAEQSFLNEDGTKVNLSGTKAAQAMQNFADLVTKYHVAPSPVQQKNIPNGATALASKKVAMLFDGQWVLQELGANKVNFGVGIAPKMYDKPYTITLGEPIVAFESTQHPQESWELQKWFMDPDNVLELITTGLWMPVKKEWYTDPALVSKWADAMPAHPEGYRDAIMTNGFDNGVPNLMYSVRNFPKLTSIINPALDKVWLGEDTVDNALKSVEEQANKEVQGLYPRP